MILRKDLRNEHGCEVCDGAMRADRPADVFRCTACGFFRSELPVRINAVQRLDEAARSRSLEPIRRANFEQLQTECAEFLPAGAKVLDVGCAHGWFLDTLEQGRRVAIGMEPDLGMAAIARSGGHSVITGYFPADLPEDMSFDAITFNDVFEHLPDLPGTLAGLRRALAPGGVVIVNLPLSDGAIFRVARLADRLGIRGPLLRMWQAGLPSPHLSYFSRATLPRLFERHGFDLLRQGRLTSLVTKGLHDRIRYDSEVGTAQAVLIHGAALCLKPLLGLLPSDIGYFVFRRRPG